MLSGLRRVELVGVGSWGSPSWCEAGALSIYDSERHEINKHI
jgi:hypothetical protein